MLWLPVTSGGARTFLSRGQNMIIFRNYTKNWSVGGANYKNSRKFSKIYTTIFFAGGSRDPPDPPLSPPMVMIGRFQGARFPLMATFLLHVLYP